jgi:hypothetical protein
VTQPIELKDAPILSDGSPAPVGAEAELQNLDVEELSLVGRPAIKRKFIIFKEDGTTELEETEVSVDRLSLEEETDALYLKYSDGVVVEIGYQDYIQLLDQAIEDNEEIVDLAISLADSLENFNVEYDGNQGCVTKSELIGHAKYNLTLAADGEEVSMESYTPTASMKKAAQRGLDWRRDFGRGGTAVGIARARDIVNGKDLSESTVKRMYSFFARHEVDKQAQGFNAGEEGFPSNGRIAWELWSGDSGYAWSKRIAARLRKSEKEITPEQKSNVYSAYMALMQAADASDEVYESVAIKKGSVLSETLKRLIDKKAKSRADRGEIVRQMAEKAGISVQAVYDIMKQKIDCPPLKRLAAFASVLGVDESILRSASRRDGCKLDKSENTEMKDKILFDKEKQAILKEIALEDGTTKTEEVEASPELLTLLKEASQPKEQAPVAPVQQQEAPAPQKTDPLLEELRKQIQDSTKHISDLQAQVKKLESAAPASNGKEPEQAPVQKSKSLWDNVL